MADMTDVHAMAHRGASVSGTAATFHGALWSMWAAFDVGGFDGRMFQASISRAVPGGPVLFDQAAPESTQDVPAWPWSWCVQGSQPDVVIGGDVGTIVDCGP